MKRLPTKTFRRVVNLLALLMAVQIVLVLVGVPGCAWRWLGAKPYSLDEPPRYIVVLGGGGIPSSSGLMRTYYAAEMGTSYPRATYIVALPADEDPDHSSVGRMRDELVMRGVSRNSILLEDQGRNTHEQAVHVRRLLGDDARDDPILIVSSPTHLRRAVLCFRKEGFSNVGVLPAHGVDAEANLGKGLWLRYGVWNNMAAYPGVFREFVAMAYYKIMGWI